MEKVILNSALRQELGAFDRPFEVYDEEGRLLGLLTPATAGSLDCPLSEEVLDRRSQETVLDMVVVLVDPDDVSAALELKNVTPPNAELLRMSAESTPPPELLGQNEERPW
jgi:hypothetical protein